MKILFLSLLLSSLLLSCNKADEYFPTADVVPGPDGFCATANNVDACQDLMDLCQPAYTDAEIGSNPEFAKCVANPPTPTPTPSPTPVPTSTTTTGGTDGSTVGGTTTSGTDGSTVGGTTTSGTDGSTVGGSTTNGTDGSTVGGSTTNGTDGSTVGGSTTNGTDGSTVGGSTTNGTDGSTVGGSTTNGTDGSTVGGSTTSGTDGSTEGGATDGGETIGGTDGSETTGGTDGTTVGGTSGGTTGGPVILPPTIENTYNSNCANLDPQYTWVQETIKHGVVISRIVKVKVCHQTNSGTPHTVVIACPALQPHITHHDDYLGSCLSGN